MPLSQRFKLIKISELQQTYESLLLNQYCQDLEKTNQAFSTIGYNNVIVICLCVEKNSTEKL